MGQRPTLPAEVRGSLPPIAQAYLASLESQVALLRAQATTLQATVSKVQGQVADLQARAHRSSGNSSRPPSSDLPGPRPHLKRTPSGRTRGGQLGHPGHARIQLGADRISARVEHRPVQCPACTLPLDAALPSEEEPIGVQVWEIPPIVPEVSEHRGYRVRCPHCGALVPAPDLPEGACGPRSTAIGGVLHGRSRLRMRETTDVPCRPLRRPAGAGACVRPLPGGQRSARRAL